MPARQAGDRLYVEAGMAEAGRITARGAVSVPSRSSVFKCKSVSARVAAGRKVKLKLRLAKKAPKLVKRALKKHRKLRANVTITATNKAGDTRTEKRTVNLRFMFAVSWGGDRPRRRQSHQV
jgi:hypothetical protein